MTATQLRLVPHPTEPTTQRRIHHTLTPRDVDLICEAADLDAWTWQRDSRDGHPLEVSATPAAALRRHRRWVDATECLAFTAAGAAGQWELRRFLLAFAAVAPAAGRDLAVYDLLWTEQPLGPDGGVDVVHLLGVTVGGAR